MNRYVELIAKYRLWLGILLVISLLASVNGARQINLSSEFDVFVTKNSEYNQRIEEVQKAFDSKDQLMVMVSLTGEEITIDMLRTLVETNTYFNDVFEDAKIVGPVMNQELDEDSLNDSDLMIFNKQLSMLGDLAPVVMKDDSYHFTFNIFLEESLSRDTIERMESWLYDAGVVYAISGDTYVQLKIYDYIAFILSRIPGLAIGILLLVFYSRIRSIKGTLLSLLPAVIGSIWTMGLLGYIGEEVSIVTVLAPIFTIVIGSADGLHFIAHMQEELGVGKPPKEALKHTLYMVGKPMIITTVTSIAGFLALMVMDTDAIRTLATFASLGVLNAGIATWFALPLILIGKRGLKGRMHSASSRQKGLKVLWGYRSIPIILLVIALFFGGAFKIPSEFNMLSMYKKTTDVYQHIEKITEVNGGALPVYIYGELPSGINPTQGLNQIYEFGQGLRTLPSVGKVMSGADFVEKLGPSALMNSDFQSMAGEFINLNTKQFKMMVLPVNHENDTLESIRDYVEQEGGQGSQYEPFNLKETGAGFMMMELNQGMMGNQIKSSLLALTIVFLLLLISLKHIKGALASLVPIVLTLLTLFGLMGLTGISINLMSSTIFSISIGVGIDYAIHFTSVWRVRVGEGLSADEATNNAYRYTATPILANAFGLSLGFSALFLSPLKIHNTIATLMWIAMVSSVIFSLIILPSILRRIRV